ncbi:MAG TPA: phosphate acyltransferase PlsX [Candidatus Onthovicinus excrementipullorum]|nr:phosphate acyltransferase PlsX [Candidatus Onthovicinus excrementipullorum]
MTIIVDAYGGDHAPLEILKGACRARDELGVTITLTGSESGIRTCAQENGLSLNGMTILDAPDVISMEDDPMEIRRSKSNSSMAVGLRALAAGEGDAFVSAGSTGALVVGSTFIVKRIKGVKRAAIASIMPSDTVPFLMLDCGANAECRPEALVQFAVMGDLYMKHVMGVPKPRVALANIGTESTKGGELQREAYRMLSDCGLFDFTGNIEARMIPYGGADVVVADGFTGNMLLKMYEGVAAAMMKNIKEIFTKSTKTKLGFLMVKGGLIDFKKKMDYTEFGGAPLLGISRPVIKAHGSSKEKGFFSAVRQAVRTVEKDVCGEIARNMPRSSEEAKED